MLGCIVRWWFMAAWCKALLGRRSLARVAWGDPAARDPPPASTEGVADTYMWQQPTVDAAIATVNVVARDEVGMEEQASTTSNQRPTYNRPLARRHGVLCA